MKKLLFLFLTIIIIGSLIFSGCGKTSTTSTTTTTTSSTTTTKTSTTTTTGGSTTPTTTTTSTTTTQAITKGGTLRVLWQTGISNLSYVAGQGMTDESLAKAYSETLCYYAGTGDFKPELAKSWDFDYANMTLTFNLEHGVKFQDGTDFNAPAVKWNVQNLIDAKRLSNGALVNSLEVVDTYTFRYHFNKMMTPSMMLHSFGYDLQTMFSPTAYMTAGSTISADAVSDEATAARKAWATSHFCSTGAFMFDSWTQDVSLKIVKNPDYWRGNGYPYLDAIVYTFVADTSIASAKMQAGEADIWGGPALKEATDLEKKGFILKIGVGGFYSDIIPNNASDDSVFKDPLVRQALEYAIDRDGLAEALGYGKLTAVYQCGGQEGSSGYDPSFPTRTYNIQKAKDLLTQAGHPGGIHTKMMIFTSSGQDMATAIQASLAEAGIVVDIDVADPGRYIGSLYAGGWEGLLLWSCPIDPEFALGWFVHFGPQAIFPYPSLKWPDEYWTLITAVRDAPTLEAMRANTKTLMRFVSDGAYIIPLITSINMNVSSAKVHTQMGSEHFMTWHNYMDWMGK
jgi:peptide/nickel transport system substrate-binding protein